MSVYDDQVFGSQTFRYTTYCWSRNYDHVFPLSSSVITAIDIFYHNRKPGKYMRSHYDHHYVPKEPKMFFRGTAFQDMVDTILTPWKTMHLSVDGVDSVNTDVLGMRKIGKKATRAWLENFVGDWGVKLG